MNFLLSIAVLYVMIDNNAENKRHNLIVERHYEEPNREFNM